MLLLPEQLKREAEIGVPRGGEQWWWELLGKEPLCPLPEGTLLLIPFDLSLFSPILSLLFLSRVLLIPSIWL